MTTSQKIIKNKLGVLGLAQQLSNVSKACKIMRYSQDSFYRFKELYEQGGVISRRKSILKNRIDTAIEEQVVALAIDNPALGQVRVSNELKKKGFYVSAGGVRSIYLQTFQLRLKTLESKVAQEGYILT